MGTADDVAALVAMRQQEALRAVDNICVKMAASTEDDSA
jgi:hypothetical protein